MTLKHLTCAALVMVGIIMALGQHAMAQTRLGIHVTQEELNIWRTRAASGPYKSAGDVQTNSPGDWDRIVSLKDAFMSDTDANRLPNGSTGSCYTVGTAPNFDATIGVMSNFNILNAAFWSMVVNGTSLPNASQAATVRTAVRDELIAQSQVTGWNFATATPWCTSEINDNNPWWLYAFVLGRLVHAYDYIRANLSAGDQATLDAWFLGMGQKYESAVTRMLNERFSDPNNGNYTVIAPWYCDVYGTTHYGGYTVGVGNAQWHNRFFEEVYLYAAIGTMQNNTALKAAAKRRVQEWLQFGIFADGTPGEFHRWNDCVPDCPTRGWGYAGATNHVVVAIADMLGRVGDTELFTYTTSNGVCGSNGGPKSVQDVMSDYGKYVNQDIVRYGTDQAGRNGDPLYRIDSIEDIWGVAYVSDVHAQAHGSLFWHDASMKAHYLRTAPNSPAYPSSPEPGNQQPWGGGSSKWPAVLFMFGQMDHQVAPYPGIGGAVASPTNLRVLSP